MKAFCLSLALIMLMAGCKKEEGLSTVTGNLEITKDKSLVGYPMYYELYTEDQYYLYLSNQFALPIKMESTSAATFSIKGLLQGNYGIRLCYNGDHWQKWVIVAPNKVNKYSIP
jgi:hypothetical protein